jgi:hypothetical protein
LRRFGVADIAHRQSEQSQTKLNKNIVHECLSLWHSVNKCTMLYKTIN